MFGANALTQQRLRPAFCVFTLSPVFVALRSGAGSSVSPPLLAERAQASLLQIIRAHQNPEFAIGLKVEEEGLCKVGNVRRVLNIDHQERAAFAVLLGEVHHLRLEGVEDVFDGFTDFSAPHEGVERLVWHLNGHEHFHK